MSLSDIMYTNKGHVHML